MGGGCLQGRGSSPDFCPEPDWEPRRRWLRPRGLWTLPWGPAPGLSCSDWAGSSCPEARGQLGRLSREVGSDPTQAAC